jgi:hypothetical protein
MDIFFFFQFAQSFQLHYGPGIDPTSNRYEYQAFSWAGPSAACEADKLTAICEPNV